MLDPDPLYIEPDPATQMIHSRTREGSTMALAFIAGLLAGWIASRLRMMLS